MTDIEWGPAIAVDGKRPGWLGDEEPMLAIWSGGATSRPGGWDAGRLSEDAQWHRLAAIKLPADHPHYRQTEAAAIDWSGELEAVHEDGRVLPASSYSSGMVDGKRVQWTGWQGNAGWIDYDTGLGADHPGWRIRNVPQPTPQADTKPDLTAEVEDMGQQLAALMERHEALAERVARMPMPAAIRTMDLRLDPDLIEARKLVAERTGRLQIECGYSRSVLDGEQDDHPAVINTLAAIKRGRALALAGEKEA